MVESSLVHRFPITYFDVHCCRYRMAMKWTKKMLLDGSPRATRRSFSACVRSFLQSSCCVWSHGYPCTVTCVGNMGWNKARWLRPVLSLANGMRVFTSVLYAQKDKIFPHLVAYPSYAPTYIAISQILGQENDDRVCGWSVYRKLTVNLLQPLQSLQTCTSIHEAWTVRTASKPRIPAALSIKCTDGVNPWR